MKLLRYGPPGAEKPGLLDADGMIRDLSGEVEDISGNTLGHDELARLRRLDVMALPRVETADRLGPCVAGIPKFICVGLNYADHAKEAGVEAPSEPVLFAKATSAVVGPNDPVMLPEGSTKLDWEVELAAVIGTRARYVSEQSALDHVAGYCICNDVSERAFQLDGTGQWIKGKSCDSFGPIGPWLVTVDAVPDPQDLHLFCDVNGKRLQDGNTANMIFGVATLISYISRYMTLEPGDIISTGTPAGVGLGMKPPLYLKAGDEMRLGIAGLGEQHQTVIPFRR